MKQKKQLDSKKTKNCSWLDELLTSISIAESEIEKHREERKKAEAEYWKDTEELWLDWDTDEFN